MANTETENAMTEARAKALQGDASRVEKQHASGKKTARERIASLFDGGSFMELETLRKDANLVAGCGTVQLRPVYCFAQDFTSASGAMTASQSRKIAKVLDMASSNGAPVVAMIDSAGVKVTEGVSALPAYAEIFSKMAKLSGISPMITIVMGECRGIAASFTQLADIAIQVKKTGVLSLHPASVMKPGKSAEALFGAETMSAQGAVALAADSEEEAVALAAELLGYLPGCSAEEAPMEDGDDLNRLLTGCNAEDGLALAKEIADSGAVRELYPAYGKAVHTLFAHVGGRSAGLIATDHSCDGGRLDAASAAKAARFIRLCDCYRLPVISLINTEGLAVPEARDQAQLMRACAQLTYAYAEAGCAKLAVITGSAVGGAYIALGGKSMADAVYAWEGAMVSPVSAQVGTAVFSDEKLTAGENRETLEKQFREENSALAAAREGLADDVIEPAETRRVLIAAMEFLAGKQDEVPLRKHGNMPL